MWHTCEPQLFERLRIGRGWGQGRERENAGRGAPCVHWPAYTREDVLLLPPINTEHRDREKDNYYHCLGPAVGT